MDFQELMEQRYTTKVYNSEYKIPQSTIDNLKNILRLSPSSINSQPWKFAIIEDRATKELLSLHSFHNRDKVLDCSHIFVFNVINNLDYLDTFFKENHSVFAQNYYENVIKKQEDHQIFGWIEKQVYITLGIFLSACASLGIDTTAMEGIDQEKYTEILELKNHKALFAVCLGKRATEDTNQPTITPKKRLPLEDIFIE